MDNDDRVELKFTPEALALSIDTLYERVIFPAMKRMAAQGRIVDRKITLQPSRWQMKRNKWLARHA